MSLLDSFVQQYFPYIVCIFLIALLWRLKPFPLVNASRHELSFWISIVKWYFRTIFFNDDKDKLTTILNDIGSLHPTPYRVKSSLLPVMFLNDPEDIQILLNNSNSLEKPPPFKVGDELMGKSIATVTVPVWKLHRRAMMPMFNSQQLEMYSDIMYKWNLRLVDDLQTSANTKKVIDLWEPLSTNSFNILSETLMGIDPETTFERSEIQKFTRDVGRITEHLLNRMFYLKIISRVVGKFNGWFQTVGDAHAFVSKVIHTRRKKMLEEMNKATTDGANFTLLDTIFTLHRPENNEDCTNGSVVHEVFLMYAAGSETSALTECYTILMLAMNPHIQDQVYREICNVLVGEGEKPISVDSIENMHLLDRCIKETLRLYPSLHLLFRFTTAKIKISNGEIVEENMPVVFSPYLLHRKPDLYENPLIWDPDHFLPERVQKRHPYSFLPFSDGPRGCIGTKFAMITMKIALASILRNYSFTTDMKMSDIKHHLDLVLRSTHGWKVRLYPRDQKHGQ